MKNNKKKNTNDNHVEEFTKVMGGFITSIMNEPISKKMLEKHLVPAPAILFKNDKIKDKNRNRIIGEMIAACGGQPRLIFIQENQPKPKYDTFPDSAMREIIAVFYKSRDSIINAHHYFVAMGILEERPEFILDMTKEKSKIYYEIMQSRFFDYTEMSYIRLASYWDRVGQLLDFIFFNIRQYEKDVFSFVLDRIKVNYIEIHQKIKKSKYWERITEYKKSEKVDGLMWLLRRRNLFVHSLHLSTIGKSVEENPIFISKYNHLDEAIKSKLQPKSEKEELKILHSHLKKAVDLFDDIIELATMGAKINKKS